MTIPTNHHSTCNIAAPAAQDDLDRAWVDQREVGLALLVHPDRAKVEEVLTRRTREELG